MCVWLCVKDSLVSFLAHNNVINNDFDRMKNIKIIRKRLGTKLTLRSQHLKYIILFKDV